MAALRIASSARLLANALLVHLCQYARHNGAPDLLSFARANPPAADARTLARRSRSCWVRAVANQIRSKMTEMPSRRYSASVRVVSVVKRLSGTARRARRGAGQSASSAWSKSVADYERTTAALRAASSRSAGSGLA